MASDLSRKRKHSDSDSAAPPSPRCRSRDLPQEGAASGSADKELRPADPPDIPGAIGVIGHAQRSYMNVTTRDQARAHYGDHYGNVYHTVMSSSTETAEEVLYKRFMKALAFDRMDFRRAAIDPAYAYTCQWIFEKARFLRWRDPAFRGSNLGFFWIKGKPGSGKSTIMKCILEHLQRNKLECAVVSFFFNARGGNLEKSTEGCYRSLLYQMLEQIPRLRTLLRVTNIPSGEQGWEIAVVQDKLREAILHLEHESLIIVIDALDECKLEEVRDMVYFLDGLAVSTRLQAISFRICLASRHYPSITIRSCESLVVEQENAHSKDIHDYVRNNLRIESRAQRHVLVGRLMQKSQGVFLWVVLVTRHLNERSDKGLRTGKLMEDISALPAGLNTLIERIISDGASDAYFLPTILWTLASDTGGRTLQQDEFCFAIQFSAGKLNCPHWSQSIIDLDSPEAIKRFVLQSSKGLAEMVDYSEDLLICQFIHESVREHILGGGLANLRPDLHGNVGAATHAIIAEWCQDYLRCDLSKFMDFSVDRLSPIWREFPTDTDSFPLLFYAEKCTLNHIDAAYRGGAYDLERLRTFPVAQWISIMNVFTTEEKRLEPTTSLLYLCLQNIDNAHDSGIIQALLERHPMHPTVSDADSQSNGVLDRDFRSTLFGTSLDESCGGHYGTPLIAAAYKCSTTLVEMLLTCGVDANITSSFGSPLTVAISASEGCLSSVRLLVDQGADINNRCGLRGSPLEIAALKGYWNIVRLLLDSGAEANIEDEQGLNLLLRETIAQGTTHPANSQESNEHVVEMLLDRGVGFERAALNVFLHMAAKRNQASTIRMLMCASADHSCRDGKAPTALHALAETRLSTWKNRGLPTADALLNFNVDVNAQGGVYGTALIAASAVGNSELVKFLLDHGAEVHHRSHKYGNAIDAASTSIYSPEGTRKTREAYSKIVQMLSGAGLE